jgi:hypothetical protein
MSTSLPDSSAVDEAIVQRLSGDPALAALMPDGVYWDVAAGNAQAFVTVSLIDASDQYLFDAASGEEIETLTYEAKAWVLDTSGQSALRAAAARIHQLLHGEALPVIEGFACLAILRRGRVRRTYVDTINDVRWLQRGGRYQVTVQPLSPTPLG